MRNSINSQKPAEGEESEERVMKLRNVAGHKRGLTNWRGGRGRSELVSFKTWQVTNEDSRTGGEEEGGGGWRASKCGTSQRRKHEVGGGRGEEGGCGRRSWGNGKRKGTNDGEG